MKDLEILKELIIKALNNFINDDGLVKLTFDFARSSYELALKCSELDFIAGMFAIEAEVRKRAFLPWDDLPSTLKNSTTSTFTVELNLKDLRKSDLNVYYDEDELVELSPIAPEKFMILKLRSNNGLCSICPDDYNRNEIQRFTQVRLIWDILRSCSDYENGRELIFLYKQKIKVSCFYSIEDLNNDFDGLRKLQNIFSNDLHESEKKRIFQNTLYTFLWKTSHDASFKKILTEFSIFVMLFEESYHSFSVGFSFDKIRKEYNERFRDYLSRLNGIMYETLTKSLAIPLSGLVSFIAMKGGFNANGIVVNIAALILIFFSTVAIIYMILFQHKLILITKEEYSGLFKSIRDELNEIELKELNTKELELNTQSDIIANVLRFIHGIALSNLVINIVMFIITTC